MKQLAILWLIAYALAALVIVPVMELKVPTLGRIAAVGTVVDNMEMSFNYQYEANGRTYIGNARYMDSLEPRRTIGSELWVYYKQEDPGNVMFGPGLSDKGQMIMIVSLVILGVLVLYAAWTTWPVRTRDESAAGS